MKSLRGPAKNTKSWITLFHQIVTGFLPNDGSIVTNILYVVFHKELMLVYDLHLDCCVYILIVVFTSWLLCLHLDCCVYILIVVFTSWLLCLHLDCCVYILIVVFTSWLLCLHLDCCVYILIVVFCHVEDKHNKLIYVIEINLKTCSAPPTRNQLNILLYQHPWTN